MGDEDQLELRYVHGGLPLDTEYWGVSDLDTEYRGVSDLDTEYWGVSDLDTEYRGVSDLDTEYRGVSDLDTEYLVEFYCFPALRRIAHQFFTNRA